jgi:hypothetical protein
MESRPYAQLIKILRSSLEQMDKDSRGKALDEKTEALRRSMTRTLAQLEGQPAQGE